MLPKARKKDREEKELTDSRLLKPATWSEELRLLDSERRKGPSSSIGKKQLDLNAPLLSVRKNRPCLPDDAAASSSRISRRSSSFSVSQRQLVPFFTWELPPPEATSPPPPPPPPPHRPLEPEEDEDEDGDDGYGSRALVLAPPPETTNRRKPARNVDVESFTDARSEFAHTETMSVAPTYRVSEFGEDELEKGGDDGDGDGALVEYNCEDRGMIMQRFLPAAKAVAREMAAQEHKEVALPWRPPIAHPSPQGQQYRKRSDEHQQLQQQRQRRQQQDREKKSFAELMKIQDEAGNRNRSRTSSDLGDGEISSQRYTVAVGSTVCGFFPLLRMLQAGGKEVRSSSSSSSSSAPRRRGKASKKKLELEGEDLPGDRGDDGDGNGGDSSGGTEWWSDEGGEGDSCDADVVDDLDQYAEFWKSSSYLSCKYTPSRGGLRSPALVESKGFLGLPRDRRLGSTYIKRMYPIVKSDNPAAAAAKTMTNTSTAAMLWTGDESDSSESLTSIRLDRLSRAASRQNSDGGMEKVFCLDTLDQMRQAGVLEASPRARKKNSFQDDRSFHPEENLSLGSKQLVEDDRLLYVPSRTKITVAATTKNATMTKEEIREESKPSAKICWKEEDDLRQLSASVSSNIGLPIPRGPSKSWLSEKLVTAPGKPPLARRKAPARGL